MSGGTYLLEAMKIAQRERGDGFTCYTERDGGPWYIVAGWRDSWHGSERVADTETANRDQARAFALFLMGVEIAGFAFSKTEERGQGDAYTCNGSGYFFAWRDACGRAFAAKP